MPAILGPIQINQVSGGVVNGGDSFYISPRNLSKVISGSGGSNVGGCIIEFNGISITTSIDPDVNDLNQKTNI